MIERAAGAQAKRPAAHAADRIGAVVEAGGDRIAYRSENPPGILVHCDNLDLIRSLPDACCDLVYADPPFMTDKRRTSAACARGFDDRWPGAISEYLAFLRPRLERMRRLLSPRGSLCVHLDWHTVHYVKVALDELFGGECFLNEIIWHYRTGGRNKKCFARKHDTLLLYARDPQQHTFNPQRDGDYRTDGLKRDSIGRSFKNTTNGPVYFHPDGPTVTDVWDMPFLSTVSSERTGYPSQKPLALLDRLIVACTNPGDVVADFFCGSGTTLVAAAHAGRGWIGCDAEPRAVEIAGNRLARAADHKKNLH